MLIRLIYFLVILIGMTARSFGAEVPFLRPKEISEDHSTDYEVFDHYIIWMHKNNNKVPNLLVHLRPTGPARTIKDIDYAVQMIKYNSEADSLKSVSLSRTEPEIFTLSFLSSFCIPWSVW